MLNHNQVAFIYRNQRNKLISLLIINLVVSHLIDFLLVSLSFNLKLKIFQTFFFLKNNELAKYLYFIWILFPLNWFKYILFASRGCNLYVEQWVSRLFFLLTIKFILLDLKFWNRWSNLKNDLIFFQ